MYEVAVIGAGIVGCAVARELSRYDMSICVLERGEDVACGATRANSGIVHAGYDPLPGTLKARYNVAGNKMFPQLARDLDFEFSNNGSLILAFSSEELTTLEALLARGQANGVEGLEIIDANTLREREPNISSHAIAALFAPTGGICDPYGAALAFAENAVANGVCFMFDSPVTHIEKGDGFFSLSIPEGTVQARCVVNAAGVFSGEVHGMVCDQPLPIHPRAGEYCLLDKEYGNAFTSTIFQTPNELGKGILVTPTVDGNLLIGPDSVPRDNPCATQTTASGLEYVLEMASKTWESIPRGGIINNFAGLRASGESGDFVVGESADVPRFFDAACIDSPGLTAAPALAMDLAAQVASCLDAPLKPANTEDCFIATRKGIPSFAHATLAERAQLIAQDAAFGHIICRCEQVTEAQIVAAIHAPIPARTTDAIKWRTRAGMGRCQAGFCLPEVMSIIARETGCEMNAVCKRAAGSSLVVGARCQVGLVEGDASAASCAGSCGSKEMDA